MKSLILTPLCVFAAFLSTAQAQTSDSPPSSEATARSKAPASGRSEANARKLAVSPSGETGVLRVGSASSLEPGLFRLSLGLDFFASDGFIEDGDSASRFGGVLGISGSPIDYLELWFNVGIASTSNNFTDPSLLQSQGDLTFGAKGFYPILDYFSMGADLQLRALTSIAESGYGAVQVQTRLLTTLDLLGLPDPIPFRAHLNFGYLYDGSSDLAPDGERLSVAEQFALGVGEFDRLVGGVAVEVPVPYVTPYLEYTIEIPLDYLATPGVVIEASAASPKQAIETDPARPAATRVLPQRITPGIRVNALDPVTFDLAVEIGITPDQTTGVPPVAPYNVVLLASYALDPFGVRQDGRGPAEPVSVPVIIPSMEGAARLTGTVVDQQSGEPIADAIVRFDRSTPVATGPDGRFESQPMQGGPLAVKIDKPGYDLGEATLELPADQGAEVQVALAPSAVAGLVTGLVSGPSGPLADVTVKASGPQSLQTQTGADGRFELGLEEGTYAVVALLDGYTADGTRVDIRRGAATPAVNLNLARTDGGATLDGGRLVTGDPLLFEAGSADLTPDTARQLRSAVDYLLRNPETKLRIEGHTDNKGDATELTELSRRRADSVKDFLVQHGVEPSRLSTAGFGPDRPVAPNLTLRGRAANNRVELIVEGAEPEPAPDEEG